MATIESPLVSVCVLTKNPGEIFKDVLGSVVDQETTFDYEVVIVDSGSTDGTLEYIKSFEDQKLRLFTIPSDEFGHGKTRNWAIQHSSGEFVVMITHDARPLNSHWLQNMIAPFYLDEKIAGVFGRHEPYEDATIFNARDLKLHFDNFKNGSKIVCMDDPARYAREEGYRQYLHYFSDNNAALRRSVWSLYNYPEVDFAEDQLWAKLIIERGFKKAYADDAAVFHSHNYDLTQTFKRSYDESRALRRLFNYNICPSFTNIGYQSLRCSHRDIKFAKETQGKCALNMTCNIIIGHILKQMGYYIGSNFPNNKMLFRMISLDNSIKRK